MNKSYVYVKNARSPEYRKKLELMEELGIDPFAKEYLDDPRFEVKKILYEKKHWIVFKNQHKYEGTKHQFVFVSTAYAENLWDLSPEAQVELISLLKEVCEKNNITGGGITTRFGDPEKSAATVKHLHVQLFEPEDGHAIAAWFGMEKET